MIERVLDEGPMTAPAVFRTKQTPASGTRGRRTPTRVQYEQMFQCFNRRLFAGSLPACLLNFSRKAKTYGFFAPERWQREGQEVRHEISAERYISPG
jgi:hypothetical protein